MPDAGSNLVVLGTDNYGLLHIRIFDAAGNQVTDTNETQLPQAQAGAVASLKQQVLSLLPAPSLTDAEKSQLIDEVRAITGQSGLYPDNASYLVTITLTDKDGKSSTVSAVYGPHVATTTSLTTSATNNESVYGQTVTLIAAIRPVVVGPFDPSGTVQILVDGADYGSPVPVINGSASVSTSMLGTGAHQIQAIYSGDPGYETSTGTVTLHVAPATLIVTALNRDMAHGDSLPAFGFTFGGFVNNDTPAVVSGTPTLSTTATPSSSAGRYPITIDLGSLSVTNYTIKTVPGNLTVHPKVQDVRVFYGSQSLSLMGLNRDLPFISINAIEIAFSDNVSVNQSDLSLIGSSGTPYVLSGLTYDSKTHEARWSLPSAIGVDQLMLSLDGTSTTGVHTTNPSIPMLGDFKQGFAVLPGDFNGDGVVNSQDLVGVRNEILSIAGAVPTPLGDLNGDGVVNISDYLAIRKLIGKHL